MTTPIEFNLSDSEARKVAEAIVDYFYFVLKDSKNDGAYFNPDNPKNILHRISNEEAGNIMPFVSALKRGLAPETREAIFGDTLDKFDFALMRKAAEC